MINKVGYACVNEHLKPKTFQSCRLKSVYNKGINYLRDKAIANIDLSYEILLWNIKNGIYMYRLSSDIMPLVNHPDILKDFKWRWFEDDELLGKLSKIKSLVDNEDIRLSMHPDQFTVINSNRQEVVNNSIHNLNYHQKVLELTGGQDIIIHVGGVYGDKVKAMNRFITNFNGLEPSVKSLIRLENDDKSYSMADVLEIYQYTMIPVVLDLHHHRCLKQGSISDILLDNIEATWDGKIPKIHISSGRDNELDRRHHDYILLEDLTRMIRLYANRSVDVMVEAKKKEYATLRVIKGINEIEDVMDKSLDV